MVGLVMVAAICTVADIYSLTVDHLHLDEGYFRFHDRLCYLDPPLRRSMERWLEVRSYRGNERSLITTKFGRIFKTVDSFSVTHYMYHKQVLPACDLVELRFRGIAEIFARHYDPIQQNHKDIYHLLGMNSSRHYRLLWETIRRRPEIDLEVIRQGLP